MNRLIVIFLALFMPALCFAEREKYVGTVGPYDVTVVLNFDDDAISRMASCVDVSGKYTYTKAGNSLRLEGIFRPWPGGSGDLSDIYPQIGLSEITKSGKVSAYWKLYPSDNGGYEGTMTLTKNGKKFKVRLRPAR